MRLVDATTADLKLLIGAVVANPNEDTPKMMLRDYLLGEDDPRADLLRVRDELRADLSHRAPLLPYVHGDYAAPEDVRVHRGQWPAHASQRILCTALVRKLCSWLLIERRSRYYSLWGPSISPSRISWDWVGKSLCFAELYACHLISANARDAWYRDIAELRCDPMNAIARQIHSWFSFPSADGYIEWRRTCEANRISMLFLSCRSGRNKARQVYDSVTAISRDYGYGQEQTHNTYQTIVDAWTDLRPWEAEQKVRHLEDQRKERDRAARSA